MELNAPFFRRSSFSLAAPCAARYLRLRRAADGIYARKSFRRGRQARVALVSKSSGPCGSAVFRLVVSFALVGVGGGEIDRIRVRISRQGARFDRIRVRFDRIGVRFDRVCPWILGDRGELAGLGSAITAFFATPAGADDAAVIGFDDILKMFAPMRGRERQHGQFKTECR